MNLHIRDVPEGVHRRLARRAKGEGMSLRQYVIRVLTDHAELPSVEEWLDDVQRAKAVKLRTSGAEAVRRSRASDDAGVVRARPRR
jgi:plasmid stability protein